MVDDDKPQRALVIRRAAALWSGPAGARRLLTGVDLHVRGNRIAAIGPSLDVRSPDREISGDGWLVLPGFVNAHHHLSQQLTRAASVGGGLIDWLVGLYPVWSRLDEAGADCATRAGIAELLLTGVTTVSDCTYFYPSGRPAIFDAQVRAAIDMGVRFVPARAGLAEIEGPVRDRLPKGFDQLVESDDELLDEAHRVLAAYHDPAPDSRCRVALGLTEKAYGKPELMCELANLAERHESRLHTHLHPRPDEKNRPDGQTAIGLLADTGWWGDRLWVAHGTQLDNFELDAMTRDGVGLCTCPSSNARFGLPIAPAWELHRLGGAVGIGVDGSASNDSGDFVAECRLAWQVQRIRCGASGGSGLSELLPRVILEWATAGGGRLLGWPELGVLTEGGLADIACFDISGFDRVLADDPLDALLLCGLGHRASLVVVNGEPVVEQGRLVSHDEDVLAAAMRREGARIRQEPILREA